MDNVQGLTETVPAVGVQICEFMMKDYAVRKMRNEHSTVLPIVTLQNADHIDSPISIEITYDS